MANWRKRVKGTERQIGRPFRVSDSFGKHGGDWVYKHRWFTTSKGQQIGVNDETGEVIAPKWYKKGQKHPELVPTLCPHCGRGIRDNVCRVHGRIVRDIKVDLDEILMMPKISDKPLTKEYYANKLFEGDIEYEKVKAYPITIKGYEDFDFFVYKVNGMWRVTEGVTGAMIGNSFKTKDWTVIQASEYLKKYSKKDLHEMTKKFVDFYGKVSPRYALDTGWMRDKKQEGANVYKWYENPKEEIVASIVERSPMEVSFRISSPKERFEVVGHKSIVLKQSDKENMIIIKRALKNKDVTQRMLKNWGY